MDLVRREVIKIGGDLAVDFANTVHSPGDPGGALHSWSDLIDFLELRGGVAPGDAAPLRAMGETDARRCAAAFAQALQLRETIRAMLGAMASKRSLRAEWVAGVNQALAWGPVRPGCSATTPGGGSASRRARPARSRPWPPSPGPSRSWSCRAGASRSASAPTRGASSSSVTGPARVAGAGARWPSAATG